MEKILRIEEIDLHERAGYLVVTDKQEIKLLIEDLPNCCENWGYFMSEDTLDDYIGAELLNISITDTALKTFDVKEVYEGYVMFVNLETNRGVLQFVAYNDHNGYYGHEATVESIQLNHREML